MALPRECHVEGLQDSERPTADDHFRRDRNVPRFQIDRQFLPALGVSRGPVWRLIAPNGQGRNRGISGLAKIVGKNEIDNPFTVILRVDARRLIARIFACKWVKLCLS
jgi:hypothetical protein